MNSWSPGSWWIKGTKKILSGQELFWTKIRFRVIKKTRGRPAIFVTRITKFAPVTKVQTCEINYFCSDDLFLKTYPAIACETVILFFFRTVRDERELQLATARDRSPTKQKEKETSVLQGIKTQRNNQIQAVLFPFFCCISWPLLLSRPRLFEGWITLSTGRLIFNRTNHAIHWMVIFPVNSVTHLSNNWGQRYILFYYLLFHCTFFLKAYFSLYSAWNKNSRNEIWVPSPPESS